MICIQAKRWQNIVGRPDIQQFAGALQGQLARKGVFIATSTFSNEARDYAKHETRIAPVVAEHIAWHSVASGIHADEIRDPSHQPNPHLDLEREARPMVRSTIRQTQASRELAKSFFRQSRGAGPATVRSKRSRGDAGHHDCDGRMDQ